MRIGRAVWTATLVLALGVWTTEVGAEVYKCQAGGRTTYQDTPCDGAAGRQVVTTPGASRSAANPAASARAVQPAGDLAGVYRQIMAATEDERRLDAQYQRELQALRARAANMSVVDADREARALNARQQQRMHAARANQDALKAELQRRCPNGAALNEHSQRCN